MHPDLMDEYENEDFEWSLAKAASNLREHGVSFEEASEIFESSYQYHHDDVHSDEEEHFEAVGRTLNWRILVVIYCHRGPRRRIISAWRANSYERAAYDPGL